MALLEAGVAQQAAQVGGGEGVDVDLALERVAVGLLGLGDGARAGADQRGARAGASEQAGALRQRREAVAVARGLAGEDDRAAGPQDAAELGEGPVEVGDVVQDGVAEDEVEALVLEGQLLGLGGDRVSTSSPSAVGGRRERASASPARCRSRSAARSRRAARRLSEK